MLNQFNLIVPEILLAGLAIIVQLISVFFKKEKKIIIFTIFFIGLVIYQLCYIQQDIGFNNSFETSKYISKLKILVIILGAMSMILYHALAKQDIKIEFITLIIFSIVGALIAISARNFILLFCALELQALCSYALSAFNRNDIKSSEAGLKYFILGALMSCIMLLGISFIYGFSGVTSFYILEANDNIGLEVGMILILSTILFKMSAVPFHFWTQDIYEGSPICAVTLFSGVQKLGATIILINFVSLILENHSNLMQILKIVSILSMIFGAFGGLFQNNLKRLMAYSAILNAGYVMIGIYLNSYESRDSAILYMFIYSISSIAFLACLIALFGSKSDNVNLEDLISVGNSRKGIAVIMTFIIFSMIGIPPLAGFFGKYYIFYNAVMSDEFLLIFVAILTGTISAFYYLRILKFIFFVKSNRVIKIIPNQRGILYVISICIGFITLIPLIFL